jgi:FkbM family methyltransferase
MHKGEDTGYYLARGHRVVAFEANPELVAFCRTRFSTEIAHRRLTIVSGAIADTDRPSVRFYKHPNTVWGTTADSWAERNLELADSEEIEVPAVHLADVLYTSGMPTFMKIDIEGADLLCLETLRYFDERPRYVSIEAATNRNELEEQFSLLSELRYERFAVVQQATIPNTEITTRTLDGEHLTYRFEADASGAFGSDVGPWTDRHQAMARYNRVLLAHRLFGPGSLVRRTRLGRGLRGQLTRLTGIPLPGWCDTHAMHSLALSALEKL